MLHLAQGNCPSAAAGGVPPPCTPRCASGRCRLLMAAGPLLRRGFSNTPGRLPDALSAMGAYVPPSRLRGETPRFGRPPLSLFWQWMLVFFVSVIVLVSGGLRRRPAVFRPLELRPPRFTPRAEAIPLPSARKQTGRVCRCAHAGAAAPGCRRCVGRRRRHGGGPRGARQRCRRPWQQQQQRQWQRSQQVKLWQLYRRQQLELEWQQKRGRWQQQQQQQ